MAEVVVDTDVVSYHFKNDTRGRLFRRHLVGKDLTIAFMTVAELNHWTASRNWGSAARARLDRFLRPYRIHWPDLQLCQLWAEVMDHARRRGRPLDKADAWIAATALALGRPIVTNNASDFEAVDGLQILTAP